jgi:hypothetical protein
MKHLILATLLTLLLAGCAVSTTADLAREVPPAEQVTIFVPDSFISAVDGESLGFLLPGDSPLAQRISVGPGMRTYTVLIHVPQGALVMEWKGRFRFTGRPGHTYHFWYDHKEGDAPRVHGRDLGPGVPLSSIPVAPAFALRSSAELEEERRIHLELREHGTPILLEYLPPE